MLNGKLSNDKEEEAVMTCMEIISSFCMLDVRTRVGMDNHCVITLDWRLDK
jgi:hypothetical protein